LGEGVGHRAGAFDLHDAGGGREHQVPETPVVGDRRQVVEPHGHIVVEGHAQRLGRGPVRLMQEKGVAVVAHHAGGPEILVRHEPGDLGEGPGLGGVPRARVVRAGGQGERAAQGGLHAPLHAAAVGLVLHLDEARRTDRAIFGAVDADE
jgi:hypothetical protein